MSKTLDIAVKEYLDFLNKYAVDIDNKEVIKIWHSPVTRDWLVWSSPKNKKRGYPLCTLEELRKKDTADWAALWLCINLSDVKRMQKNAKEFREQFNEHLQKRGAK